MTEISGMMLGKMIAHSLDVSPHPTKKGYQYIHVWLNPKARRKEYERIFHIVRQQCKTTEAGNGKKPRYNKELAEQVIIRELADKAEASEA